MSAAVQRVTKVGKGCRLVMEVEVVVAEKRGKGIEEISDKMSRRCDAMN
jgi:hypothetical protein